MKQTILIVMLCAVFAATLVAGCMEEEPPISAPTYVYATETPTSISTPVTTPTKEDIAPISLTINIGETAENRNTEVTVIGAYQKYYYDYYGYGYTFSEEASYGNTFIFANINIKHVGENRAYHGASEFSITDSNGYRYDASVLYMKDNKMEYFKELYQNQQMTGVVMFEVPKDAIGLKIQYDFGNMFGRTQIASWRIPDREVYLESPGSTPGVHIAKRQI